jgi:aminoglycoside phosphotransferase (APT) family kinase protein
MTEANSFDFDTDTLSAYLEQHIQGFTGPLSAKKFSGGQSNPTFLLEAASGKYVLRRKPPGQLLKSAHAVDREFKVISALKDTDVPVAQAYHLCEDDSIIGSMFYVMEFIDGRVMWDPALPEETPERRREIFSELISVLAKLHSVDIDQAGLSDYGRPGNYYERQINRWTKQYRATETEPVADMETLIEWLPANTPADDGKLTLVHGDFRLDNLMFHPTENRVLAVVDWELSTLGHPYSDLAYQCIQLRTAHDSPLNGLGGLDREALGVPSEQELVQMYCAKAGIDSIPNWNFYIIFSLFRAACILQGVRKRALSGNASSKQATLFGEQVLPLSKMAAELIKNA